MGQLDFDQKEKNEIMFNKLRLLKIKPEIKILKNDQTTKNEVLNPLMFNLSHLLRCHSKQNDPNDSNSQVSDAANLLRHYSSTNGGTDRVVITITSRGIQNPMNFQYERYSTQINILFYL